MTQYSMRFDEIIYSRTDVLHEITHNLNVVNGRPKQGLDNVGCSICGTNLIGTIQKGFGLLGDDTIYSLEENIDYYLPVEVDHYWTAIVISNVFGSVAQDYVDTVNSVGLLCDYEGNPAPVGIGDIELRFVKLDGTEDLEMNIVHNLSLVEQPSTRSVAEDKVKRSLGSLSAVPAKAVRVKKMTINGLYAYYDNPDIPQPATIILDLENTAGSVCAGTVNDIPSLTKSGDTFTLQIGTFPANPSVIPVRHPDVLNAVIMQFELTLTAVKNKLLINGWANYHSMSIVNEQCCSVAPGHQHNTIKGFIDVLPHNWALTSVSCGVDVGLNSYLTVRAE